MAAVAEVVQQRAETNELRPQSGKQELFLSTPADIAIYGGQAFGGKTFSLLMDPLRFIRVRGFGAVIFREHATDITQEGGLWDEAMKIYPHLGGRPRATPQYMDFRFPAGSRISFSHMGDEKMLKRKQGGQIAMAGYDQVEHIDGNFFWYMFSRMRTGSGVTAYVRATCNPDPDSWVADFIAWWIDQEPELADGRPNPEYGQPIEKRSGIIRYMVKIDEQIHWFDTEVEAIAWQEGAGFKKKKIHKSVTFIPASRYDNPIGMEGNPDYEGNLYMMDRVNRARQERGNWKVRAEGGLVFNRGDFEIIEQEDWMKMQKDVQRTVRSWDFGATEAKRTRSPKQMMEKLSNDPDWTVGLKASLMKNRDVVFSDMRRDRKKAGGVEDMVKAAAQEDGRKVVIRIPQDPGQAGKAQVENYQKKILPGYIVKSEIESGSKLVRIQGGEGYASYAEHGHVKLVRGPWNDIFLSEHEAMPSPGVHDDTVDSAGGAYRELTDKPPSTAELLMARRKAKR